MGNVPRVGKNASYPVVLHLNPNISEGTEMLVSNIFLEFSLLKSMKKRHYDRHELSQRVRGRQWSTKELPIITRIEQIPEHRIEATFHDDAIFNEFRRFVIHEFSFLAVPTGTLLATVERPGPGKKTIVRKIKVNSYYEVHRRAPGFGCKKRQAGAIVMHVDNPSSPDPSNPPAYYTVPNSKPNPK